GALNDGGARLALQRSEMRASRKTLQEFKELAKAGPLIPGAGSASGAPSWCIVAPCAPGWCAGRGSERGRARFARADADHLFEVGNEDLAVADLPGVGRLRDRLDGRFEETVVHRHLHLHL